MQAILTLNIGSSNVKFAVYTYEGELDERIKGKAKRDASGKWEIHYEQGVQPLNAQQPADVVWEILEHVERLESDLSITAIGHRIVCGGADYTKPVTLDARIIKDLEQYAPLAPSHQMPALEAAERIAQQYPNVAQVACFDTAFHATIPAINYTYALPQPLRDAGIRRYGYHGLSYEWIAGQLKAHHPKLYSGNVIVMHLGNGSSLCAMQGGKSIDTTMGYTSLEGPPMGTRSGTIDPGIILHAIKQHGYTVEDLERDLHQQSGLLGLSGLSHNVEVLKASDRPEAAFSLEYFTHEVAKHAARMAVSLKQLDALIFTGGIGENNVDICQKIMDHLSILGPFETFAIATNEEHIIAGHVAESI